MTGFDHTAHDVSGATERRDDGRSGEGMDQVEVSSPGDSRTLPVKEQWTPTVRGGEKLEDVPLRQWVGEALGYASMCWMERPRGEFDSVRLNKVYDALMNRIEQHLVETIERIRRTVLEERQCASDG